MEIGASLRYILEIAFGVIYMIGAGFNFAYTLRHGEALYSFFAKNTWFPRGAGLSRDSSFPTPGFSASR